MECAFFRAMAYACAKNTTICTWCVSSEVTDCMKELRISEWHSDNVLNMISPLYENTTYSFIHPLTQSVKYRSTGWSCKHLAIFFLIFCSLSSKNYLIELHFRFNNILKQVWKKNPHVNCSCRIDPYKTWAYSHRYSYRFDGCVRKLRKFVFANMINYFQPHFEHECCILLGKLC